MASGSVRVRRVGFRLGTDDELAAMHLVETEIEAERWPGRAPQPLDSYRSFARSLPSQFDDHTWLAEAGTGEALGCSACWSNGAGDPGVMECYVYVRPSWRRQSIGRRLAGAVIEEAQHERRSMLVWATYGSAASGESFSRRLGGRVARVNRMSELHVEKLDGEMLRSWIDDGRGRALGYSLDFSEGPFPPHLLEDAARFHDIMNTAPREDLAVGNTTLTAQQVAEIDYHHVESGRERWTIFVRDPEGGCVGGTEMTFASWQPAIASQEDTAIDPVHRGLGLGKWAKAAMLARIQEQRPEVTVVLTGNTSSNEPMLAINDALGFKVITECTQWQADVSVVSRYEASSPSV